MLVVIPMLSFRIFCSWSYVTFGPVSVRNWGRERWWYASCPKMRSRRKSQVFLLDLILLPCWVRYQSRNPGAQGEKQGFPIEEQEWLYSRESPGSAWRWVGCTPLSKQQIHPRDGWNSVWWLCFSRFLNGSLCSAETQWHSHFQTVFSFPVFLNDFPPLLFPALLNGLFAVAASTPNHPSLYCSNTVLAGVTSVEQKWACWHFVKPCLRPSICFILNWVDLWGWLRL